MSAPQQTQDPPGRTGTRSIERALVVLRELATRPRFGWGLSDLADRCRLDKGTTHRILACLCRERLAMQRHTDRHYLPGPMLFELGLALPAYASFQQSARAPLARIVKHYGGVAGLTLRSGSESVYVARAGIVAVKGMSIEIGDRRPLAMTSAGVSILIALPASESRTIVRDNLRTIASMGRERVRLVREMFQRSLEAGYGVNHDNTVVGIRGYGVALRDRAGAPFAALSVAAPASTFERVSVAALVATLREEASALERTSSTLDVDAPHDAESFRLLPT